MSPYKPLPPGTKPYITQWACGDDCMCAAVRLAVDLPPGHPSRPAYATRDADFVLVLWESSWYYPASSCCLEEEDGVRSEVADACRHYGLEADLSGRAWEWKGSPTKACLSAVVP